MMKLSHPIFLIEYTVSEEVVFVNESTAVSVSSSQILANERC